MYESTYPMAAPRTRPRRWPLILPFGLVVVLAAVWSGVWFLASAKAETTLADWRAREAKAGRVYSCEKQTIGGFPFRIEVRCAELLAELRSTEPPVALKAKDLLAAVQVYDPKLVISELEGPLTIGEPGKPPGFVANWTLGQSSVRGTPEAPERVSFVFDEPVVQRIGEGGNTNLFKAQHAELHGRIKSGSAADHPIIDLALLLTAASGTGAPSGCQDADRCRYRRGAARSEGFRAKALAGAISRIAGGQWRDRDHQGAGPAGRRDRGQLGLARPFAARQP